ncbi:MAG: hypothetical protein AAFR51_02680 [Pseudomonadota bacterium]
MGGKLRLSNRVKRYIGAAIAAGVTTFIALGMIPEANAQTCSLGEAMAWQVALNDPDVEQSPDYIREVTETFIAACPDRPEIPEAHQIAGIAAADMRDTNAAIHHFRNAGPMRDLMANFYAMASFLAAGEARETWRLRDRVIESWRSRIERHPHTTIDSEPTPHGMIYAVNFPPGSRGSGPRAAWVAVPFKAGWPATLSVSDRGFIVALRKTRGSNSQAQDRYIELNRCHHRRTMGRIDASVSSVDFDATARASLTAYLANPDGIAPATEGPAPCIMPDRLLPSGR